jgi:hypothetical protein
MSAFRIDRKFDRSFSVDDKFFNRLAQLVDDPLRVSVKLSNDIGIDNLSIPQLLELPNSKSRRIQEVEVATSYDAGTRLSLSLSGDSMPISYTVVGDAKNAQYLSSELTRLLHDHFQSYSWFSNMSLGWKAFLTSICWVGGMAATFVGSQGIDQVLAPSKVIEWLGVILVVSLIAYSDRHRIFPIATFSIGDGVARSHKLENIRLGVLSVIFGGVVLALVVHLFGTYLATRLCCSAVHSDRRHQRTSS